MNTIKFHLKNRNTGEEDYITIISNKTPSEIIQRGLLFKYFFEEKLYLTTINFLTTV